MHTSFKTGDLVIIKKPHVRWHIDKYPYITAVIVGENTYPQIGGQIYYKLHGMDSRIYWDIRADKIILLAEA